MPWRIAPAGRGSRLLHLDHRVVAVLGAGNSERQRDLRGNDGVPEVLVEGAPIDDDLPSPGINRTRATLVLRRPVP